MQPDYFLTYEDKTAGFSIGYPDDWVLSDAPDTDAFATFDDQYYWTTSVVVFFYEGDTEKGNYGESRTNNQILEQNQYNWSENCEDSTFEVDDRICYNIKVIDSTVLYTNDNRKVYLVEVTYRLEWKDHPQHPDHSMKKISGLIYDGDHSWTITAESMVGSAKYIHFDEIMHMINKRNPAKHKLTI